MRSYEEKKQLFAQTTLYPVVTPEFCAGRDPLVVVSEIMAGGAKLLQLRWKKPVSDAAYYELAKAVRKKTLDFNAVMIMDDRIDLALAVGADGVHLGQEDIPLSVARRIAPKLVFGVSTHNLNEIRQAHIDGADYLNVGPIFPTATKSVSYPCVGVENLQRWMPEIKMPFSVMGGIKLHNIPQLLALGVRRPAMVTEITAAENVRQRVEELLNLIG